MIRPTSQAARIIEKCGGAAVVARICRVDVSRVHRWRMSKRRGGTDGLIPARHHQTLLEGARARGLDLKPADFFDEDEGQGA